MDARHKAGHDGAKRVEGRMQRALDHIARHPKAAETVEQRPDVRRLPLTRYPYVIYYEVGRDVVTILRILHGARRPPWLWVGGRP